MRLNNLSIEVKDMERSVELESLAAKKRLSENGGEFYLTALKRALNNKDNKNIAITGGYGAGKTTIIDSYFEDNSEENKEMMRISIATFQTDKDKVTS